jgi:hypothetical protein
VQLEQSIQLTVGPVWVGKKDPQTRRIPHSLNARLHWEKRYQWNEGRKEEVWDGVLENRRKLGKLPYPRAKVIITLATVHRLDLD